MTETADHWAAADSYEQFMGRWSRELAPRFVHWIDAGAGLHWLDLGCGTGALSAALCADAAAASVIACDPSEPFIEYARAHHDDACVSFVLADADDFPLRPGGYGGVASLLALNFFPDPGHAVARMKASLSAGGTLAACVWDYENGMQYLRSFWDAAKTISPDAAPLDEAARFPVCAPDALEALFRTAGLLAVRSEALDVPTRFRSFDDYWEPLLGGTGPAPSFVAALDSAGRAELRRVLEQRLPIASDGSIALNALAWAVRGQTGRSGNRA